MGLLKWIMAYGITMTKIAPSPNRLSRVNKRNPRKNISKAQNWRK